MKPQCNTSAECLHEMIPTIEEVKRVADECGIIDLLDPFAIDYDGFYEKAQAFAQHYIEVGRKEALDASQDATHLCRYCKLPYKPTGWNEDCPACGCDGTDEWIAIRNNTGE